MVRRALPGGLGVTREFIDLGDGQRFRREYQDGAPIIEHARRKREINEAPSSGNQMGLRHEGTVPILLVTSWCQANGYTFDQWARNEGHEKGAHWRKGTGVKDKFMIFFKTRDHSKLHSEHVTTKKKSSQILLPGDPDYVLSDLRRP